MFRLLAAVAALFTFIGGANAESAKPTLTIYTYDSFVASWGPGPLIEAAFEAECECDLEWIGLGDGATLLARLRLEGASTSADVILGLDTSLAAEAKETGLLAPHGLQPQGLTLPTEWTDRVFLPYDYGHFAFVYDSERIDSPPAGFEDLIADEGPLVILQDPRTSTPGLGLMLWVRRQFGERAGEIWEALRPRVVTVTKGWSEAYGLFLEGEAPMVLSYATSPAYHAMYDDTDRYRAAIFSAGHYPQVEVAARTAASDEPELAQRFLAFMLTPGFQRHIPAANIMRPVIDLADELPEEFRSLPVTPTLAPFSQEEVARNRRAWIDEWLEHLTR